MHQLMENIIEEFKDDILEDDTPAEANKSLIKWLEQ